MRGRPNPGSSPTTTHYTSHHDGVLLEQLVQILAIHVGLTGGARYVSLRALHEPGQITFFEVVLPALFVVAIGERGVEVARARRRAASRCARPSRKRGLLEAAIELPGQRHQLD